MALRAPTYLELAAFIAIGGSVLAVTVPAFLRNLHASRFSEAIEGLSTMSRSAVAYAEAKAPLEAFPPPAPLTPSEVPRGERVLDPPGTWDHLTWAALGFSINHEHSFSFAFDSNLGPAYSTFTARAHGDLDGDGERSTFEIRGETTPNGPRIVPGLHVEREVE